MVELRLRRRGGEGVIVMDEDLLSGSLLKPSLEYA